MSYTNLNLNLTKDMANLLSQPGIFVDVVYTYGQNGPILPINNQNVYQLVDGSAGKPLNLFTSNADGSYTLTTPIPLTSANMPTVSGGKFYVLVASVNNTGTEALPVYVDPIPAIVTQQSAINPINATGNNFTYGSIEFTLSGAQGDIGNLTNINGYGLSFGLSAYDTTTTSPTLISSGSYNLSGNKIFSGIYNLNNNAVTNWSQGPLATGNNGQAFGQFANTPANGAPYSSNDWSDYISKLATWISTQPAGTAKLAGYYNGGVDAYKILHNGAFFNYNISIDPTTKDYVLTPAPNSEVRGTIVISQAELQSSIYATNGNFRVYDGAYSAATPTSNVEYTYMKGELLPALPQLPINPQTSEPWPSPANYAGAGFNSNNKMNVGFNNAWGEIFTQFITGLDAGYMGKTATSSNPTGANLSDSSNWNLHYAFNNSVTDNTGSTKQTADPFSQLFFAQTNAYAFQYSDELSATGNVTKGGPQLNIANGNGDAGSLNLTLFHPNETPGAVGGFVQPQFSDYIAPSNGAAYQNFLATGGIGIVLTIDAAYNPSSNTQTAYVVDPSQIHFTLSLMDANTGLWQAPIAVNQLKYGPWLNYTAAYAGSAWSLTPQPTTNSVPYSVQNTGTIGLYGLNINTDANIDTYNLRINATSNDGLYSKTFNLYIQEQNGSIIGAAADGGAFVNFTTGAVSLDLIANNFNQIAPDYMIKQMVVNNPAAGTINNPNLPFQAGPAGSPTAITATVVGQWLGGNFVIVDQIDQNSVAPTNTVNAPTSNSLVFGWTGLNPSANVSWTSIENKAPTQNTGWISNPTNKVNPKDIVQIHLDGASNDYDIFTQADLEGMWSTSNAITDTNMQALINKYQGSGPAPIFGGATSNIAAGKYAVTIKMLDDVGGQLTKIAPDSASLSLQVSSGSLDFSITDNKLFIADVYTKLINRAPEESGLVYWQKQLRDGLSRVNFVTSVLSSEEFHALNPANDDYVDNLYIGLLGRGADVGGRNFWDGLLNNGLSREVVALGFIHSDEFIQHMS